VDPKQLKFLQRRLRQASLEQPGLKRLKSLLLRLGGAFIVAPPKPDADIQALLDSGFVMSGTAMLKRGRASMCHQNVASLWKARRFGIIGIASGYALSEDGLWRQHSWGLLRDGLLETTEPRVKYFGILLQGERADYFASCNAPEIPAKPVESGERSCKLLTPQEIYSGESRPL
jgi:hypothetical protein